MAQLGPDPVFFPGNEGIQLVCFKVWHHFQSNSMVLINTSEAPDSDFS